MIQSEPLELDIELHNSVSVNPQNVHEEQYYS